MRLGKALAVIAFAGAAVFTIGAQQKPAHIMGVEFQTPKNGMIKQYEAGRKAKAEWHKSKNDPRPLWVWETMTGDHTGTYIVGQPAVTWKEMDNPPISDDVDQDMWQRTVGEYTEKLAATYYEHQPDLSWPSTEKMPAKFSEVVTFNVHQGKTDAFVAAIKKINAAISKAKWGSNYNVYSLVYGGSGNTFVVVFDHPNYADFEEPAKSFNQLLAEAMGGKEAAAAFMKSLDATVDSSEAQIIKFRPDLSYIPDGMK
jgi:hypothetical protein